MKRASMTLAGTEGTLAVGLAMDAGANQRGLPADKQARR